MGKYPKGEYQMVKRVRRSYTKAFKTEAINKVINSPLCQDSCRPIEKT